MEIQKARLRDLISIIEINKFIDYENPDSYIQDAIDDGRVLTAIQDDRVVGFTLYEKVWGNTPLLTLIKVHPDYQNKLIGTKLIKYLEDDIQQSGFNFYCSSTTVDNILSRKFHNKLGFQETGILELPHGKEVFFIRSLSK